MKVRIKNKLPIKRSVPTPGNTSVSIGALSTVCIDYPAGYEKFFKGLEMYDFEVQITKTPAEPKTLGECKLTDTVGSTFQGSDKSDNPDGAEAVGSGDPSVGEPEADGQTDPDAQSDPAMPPKADSTPVETDPNADGTPAEVNSNQVDNGTKNMTDDQIEALLKELNSDQLKAICNELSIVTSASKESTLINKIFESESTNADIYAAYTKVVK